MALLKRAVPARAAVRRLPWLPALLLGLGLNCAAATPEYELKAVFLFRFAEFVEWPPQAFSDAQAPLAICVLGDDPFGGYLDDAVRGEKVNDRPLVVRRVRDVDSAGACHIVFISSSEHEQMRHDLAALKGRSILTVSDNEGFDRAGGMIGLALADNRIRLEVNPGAAKAADLKLSSKLLVTATIVSGEN